MEIIYIYNKSKGINNETHPIVSHNTLEFKNFTNRFFSEENVGFQLRLRIYSLNKIKMF